MSKRYDREQKRLESLELQNRVLKHENKRLKKQVKELSRGYYKFLNSQDDEDEKEAVFEAKQVAGKICWDCKVGTLQLIDLVSRYYRQCDNCEKRTKSKPISELKK